MPSVSAANTRLEIQATLPEIFLMAELHSPSLMVQPEPWRSSAASSGADPWHGPSQVGHKCSLFVTSATCHQSTPSFLPHTREAGIASNEKDPDFLRMFCVEEMPLWAASPLLLVEMNE